MEIFSKSIVSRLLDLENCTKYKSHIFVFVSKRMTKKYCSQLHLPLCAHLPDEWGAATMKISGREQSSAPVN